MTLLLLTTNFALLYLLFDIGCYPGCLLFVFDAVCVCSVFFFFFLFPQTHKTRSTILAARGCQVYSEAGGPIMYLSCHSGIILLKIFTDAKLAARCKCQREVMLRRILNAVNGALRPLRHAQHEQGANPFIGKSLSRQLSCQHSAKVKSKRQP